MVKNFLNPQLACLLALLAFAPASHAGAEDDLLEPGQFGVDLHNNFVPSGRRKAAYAGEQPPGKVYRLTPQFAYGMSNTTELGIDVLTTRAASGSFHADGVKARIKYIAPHDAKAGFFWGANLEFGRSSLRISEQAWNAQIKGIFGYRSGPWLLAANPNFGWSLSGGGPVSGALDTKFSYALDATLQLGFETYNELGPLRRMSLSGDYGRTLFAVVDKDFGAFDLNLGIGRGLTPAADRWTLKFIVGANF